MLSVRPVVVVGRMPQMLTAPATVNAKSASSALSRRHQIVHAERVDGPSEDTTPEGIEGLTPEEDYEIPGTYRDAMSSNTQLGKAVRDACAELDALAELEQEALSEADALLKKLGYKGSIFNMDSPKESSSS